MSEANFLHGQFRGWSEKERDNRVQRLISVVSRFKPISFHTSVARTGDWEEFKPVAPRGIASPHFTCCFLTVSAVSRHFSASGLPIKVEFIFDQQNGLDDDIGLFFDFMKSNLPRGAQELIASKPIFRDDKLFAPIQAADLLAWHLRKAHEKNGGWDKGDPSELGPINSDVHLFQEADSLVQGWTEKFAKMPAINQMKSKSQWKRLKADLRESIQNGYVPPYGTKTRNVLYSIRDSINRILGR